MNPTGHADIDLSAIGNGGDDDDIEGGDEQDSSGDLMGLKGGKKQCYTCEQWDTVRSCLEKRKSEARKGEKGKTCKGWWWIQKGKGKGQGPSKHERLRRIEPESCPVHCANSIAALWRK